VYKRPLVSIVTPSFNQAPFLEATIRSVIAQSYLNIEYIVMDGGSDDGSLEIIKKYDSDISHWQSKKDDGQTDAINQGFEKAKGKYLAWLNADDVYLAHTVEEAVAYLEEHPEVGMVYGDADFINASGQVVGKFPAAQTNYSQLMRGYVHVPQQAAFWRADLWEKVKPLDESFYFAMDYDLWVRLAKISSLKYLPVTWAQFRMHGDSKTIENDFRAWPEMLAVHRKQGGHWFSAITFKYFLRRLLTPLIAIRRRRLIKDLD
jgi:glycosyltransferase involved in cell wall biosynthesis